MHLFYLKRSGDGGRGSLEMMAFLVKGWKLNLIISVKITQKHLWFYTLLKIFPTKTSGNICRSRASGNQKGKVHGKNTTFYNSSMPGTVREKLSSRKFPDIWTLVGIYGWQLPGIRGAEKMAGCVPYSPPRHVKTWISCGVFTISDTQEIGQHGMASQNALEREREGEGESEVLSGFFLLMLDLLIPHKRRMFPGTCAMHQSAPRAFCRNGIPNGALASSTKKMTPVPWISSCQRVSWCEYCIPC